MSATNSRPAIGSAFGRWLVRLVAAGPMLVASAGIASAASGSGSDVGRGDPFIVVLLTLGLMTLAAMIGRGLAGWARQPAVLGELLIGVAVGNVGYWLGVPLFAVIMHFSEVSDLLHQVWGFHGSVADAATALFGAQRLASDPHLSATVNALTQQSGANATVAFTLWIFSNLGLILLLFLVGLETNVPAMRRVGAPAFAVAVTGVVAPVALGFWADFTLRPMAGVAGHLFIGATLAATSVGITAAVFRDLGRLAMREAQIILGAAVIDDVLGLILLSVVVGIVTSGSVDVAGVARIVGLSLLFLGTVLLAGRRLVRFGLPLFRALDRSRMKLLYPLILCLFLSWLASVIGLAPIVGAFAAGVIVEEGLFGAHRDKRSLGDLVRPLESVFAPVFFVLIGMQVNLATLLRSDIVWLVVGLTLCGIGGKLIAGWAAGRRADPLTIGIGMMPRGEVGLVFATVGRSLGVVSIDVYAAVVMMIVLTTFLAPVGLRWALGRTGRGTALTVSKRRRS